MPIGLTSLFERSIQIQRRVLGFTKRLESMVDSSGRFVMNAGQPIDESYRYYDPDSGELVWLWRTQEDTVRHAKYRRYREVLRKGIRTAMDPELFEPDRRNGARRRVRAYDLPQVISEALTTLTCGGGVEAKTGLDALDEQLESMQLDIRARNWFFEASYLGFVGVEIDFDLELQALDWVRILPDHLYLIWDPNNNERLLHIDKRIWMPIEAVSSKWQPLTKTTQGSTTKISVQTEAKRTESARDVDSLTQDGFVYEEQHWRGWTARHLYAVAKDEILCEVALELYDPELAKEPVVFTGMDSFAIIPIINPGCDGRPVSDWDTILDPAIDFSERATKNGRLVDRYSAPKMVVPQTMIQVDPWSGHASFGIGDDDVIVSRPTDKMVPSFLQPSAEFTAPKEDLDFALSMVGVLSGARYAIDPMVLENADSGVALKLKMTPAISKVTTRREAFTHALRDLLFNTVCALEFYSSAPEAIPGDGEVRFVGGIGALLEATLDRDGNAESTKLSAGPRVYFADAQAAIAGVTVYRGVVSRGQDGVPQMGDVAVPHQSLPVAQRTGQPESASSLIAEHDQAIVQSLESELQKAMSGRTVSTAVMQQQAAAIDVAQTVFERKSVRISLVQGIPQDEVQASQRVGEGTMSLRRFLIEYDGMEENEADEEIALIRSDQESALGDALLPTPAPPGADLGGMPDDPVAALTRELDGAIAADGLSRELHKGVQDAAPSSASLNEAGLTA